MNSDMIEGKRYLVEKNGVQFAVTCRDDRLVSDIDGMAWAVGDFTVIRELTGLEAMKVGDLIVAEHGEEAEVIAITNNHTAFLRSGWDDSDNAGAWYKFTEAKNNGWKLKSQPEDITEITLEEIAKLKGVPVEKIRVKE